MCAFKTVSILLSGIIWFAACEQHTCPEDVQVHISISKDRENRMGWETTYVKKLTDTVIDMVTLPRLPIPYPLPANLSDSGPGSPRDTLHVKVWTGKPGRVLKKKDDDD